MTFSDETIRGLREAVQLTPDNIPLRQALAQALGGMGRWDEAESELRDALNRAPNNADLKLSLARASMQLGKTSQAIVILESLIDTRSASGAAYVLYARLLFQEGRTADAVAQYRLGVEEDEGARDPNLESQLGIDAVAGNDVVDGRLRESWDIGGEAGGAEVERPKLKFSDVGGMSHVKEEISIKILAPLKHPELYKAYGKAAGGGILMYGPPGCGKTYLARATAGEIGAGFIAVGINDVLDMWIGNSERNLNALFDQARRNRPCVLFFDEADALGSRRSDMNSGHGRQLINQFLSEMDGVDGNNEGVLVLAATNAPWHIDPAFRRPGRFDRVLFVPPPDLEGRAEILRLQLTDKPQETIDFKTLAKKTDGFSGADLKSVVDIAVEHKLRDAFRTGIPQPLTQKDLLAAISSVRPSTREWFSTARNYAIYSNEGGVYDDVLKYLKR